MIIFDQITEANRIEYLENLLKVTQTTLESVTEQRDGLAEEIENLKASGIHTCHDQCKRPMCAMRRQRDGLAEACKLFMRVIGDPNASAEDWWATEDEINAAWNSGSEALDAVEGGSDDN